VGWRRYIAWPPFYPSAFKLDNRILFVFLTLAATLFAFIKLASEVSEGDTLAFDRWFLMALRSATDLSAPIGPTWLHRAMIDVTALGGVSVLSIIIVIAAGYLVAARNLATALFLLVSVVLGALVGTLLKMNFARTRPDLVTHLVQVDTTSFPSGHAMNSAIIYLTLGALLARAEKDRIVRVYIVAVAMGLALVIGFSRIYLGVHWPSDVIAGWCVGAAWAILCSLTMRALQRLGTVEPPSGTASGAP
jgi:undecaprenyl-diphosphatase